ncbi:MAG: twin-arginine translocation signal domain-containing protein [Planctomycetota bacterium]
MRAGNEARPPRRTPGCEPIDRRDLLKTASLGAGAAAPSLRMVPEGGEVWQPGCACRG